MHIYWEHKKTWEVDMGEEFAEFFVCFLFFFLNQFWVELLMYSVPGTWSVRGELGGSREPVPHFKHFERELL